MAIGLGAVGRRGPDQLRGGAVGPRGLDVLARAAWPPRSTAAARVEDLRRRAVAALELDDLGRGPVAVDVEQEAGVGAVPPVDRLLRVAHGGDVVAVAPPRLEQPELQRVHVLELVDEQVAEAPALGGGEAVVLLEGAGAQREQVVEVDEPAALLARLVGGVDLGDQLGLERRLGGSPRHDRLGVVVRGDHPGLGPLDLRGQVGGHASARPAGDLGGELGEHPALAVEQGRVRVRPWSAQRVRSAPQATAWKVPAVASPRRPRRPSRSSSSPAALRVKVRASTCRGSAAPVATRWAMRRVRTRVLPDPAGARTTRGMAVEVTAAALGVVEPLEQRLGIHRRATTLR